MVFDEGLCAPLSPSESELWRIVMVAAGTKTFAPSTCESPKATVSASYFSADCYKLKESSVLVDTTDAKYRETPMRCCDCDNNQTVDHCVPAKSITLHNLVEISPLRTL